jgi:hypothetical protein
MPIYRMTVKTTFPGGTGAGTNTWHFRKASVIVPGPDTMINAVKKFYDDQKALYGSTYKWTWDGTLTEVATSSPSLVAIQTGWTVQGSSGGNMDTGPSGVGLCVTWRSAIANRRGRGRTFIAPLPAQWYQSDGTILDVNLATVRTAASALVSTSLADGNGAIQVFSHVDQIGRDIVTASVTDRVAFLSSRRA